MKKLLAICVLLFFAANVYASVTTTLVYDGGGPQASIQGALTELGIPFDLRGPGNPVMATDLATHNLLVVGWNYQGDLSGLSASVLESGITGNILLTGHDADVHTVHGYDLGTGGDAVDAAATAFLSQAISFAQAAPGRTGLVALADFDTALSYLPGAWGISATGGLVSENVSSFTAAGLASGVYAGLTPADMSAWGESYHNEFTAWGAGFLSFELGNYDEDVVTIARIIPAPGAILLTSIGVGLVGWLRRRRTL